MHPSLALPHVKQGRERVKEVREQKGGDMERRCRKSCSLLSKMPPDRWRQFANLRSLYACGGRQPMQGLLEHSAASQYWRAAVEPPSSAPHKLRLLHAQLPGQVQLDNWLTSPPIYLAWLGYAQSGMLRVTTPVLG